MTDREESCLQSEFEFLNLEQTATFHYRNVLLEFRSGGMFVKSLLAGPCFANHEDIGASGRGKDIISNENICRSDDRLGIISAQQINSGIGPMNP